MTMPSIVVNSIRLTDSEIIVTESGFEGRLPFQNFVFSKLTIENNSVEMRAIDSK